ncbi:MAG: ASCH domain-containing protein [Clostridia bacterium]|nr:ASCH domain-containing protein [Clostridia bacterium]
MCNIIISIKPKYVEEIFSGNKRYEYRKCKCKENIDKIIIYSTFPVKKIVGEAKVEEILEDSPEKIWKITENESGINYKFYNEYYENRKKAVAYKLTDIKKYDIPRELSYYGLKIPPQSYRYITQN